MIGKIKFKDILNELSKRELRLADLEKENKDLKALRKYETTVASAEIEKLQEKNAELDCQKNRNKFCYSCANAEDRCFKNEIGCPCEKYKSYKDENAELKEHHKSVCENLTNTHRNIREQLTEAKEIIENIIQVTWGEGWNYSLDWKVKAEEFLKCK